MNCTEVVARNNLLQTVRIYVPNQTASDSSLFFSKMLLTSTDATNMTLKSKYSTYTYFFALFLLVLKYMGLDPLLKFCQIKLTKQPANIAFS